MTFEYPTPVPEIPVANIGEALEYYTNELGFEIDWSDEELGLAGVSRGNCRLFIADESFRSAFGSKGPIVIWLNLESTAEVDGMYAAWKASGVTMLSAPELKPWRLYEFSAVDQDGNKFRVFHGV